MLSQESNNLQRIDRTELLSVTRNLTLERKAELIFLHCVHGEEIIGDDKWLVDEVAELYGIRPYNNILKNCYSDLYSFREIYNLMYTYPEGFEDRELKFEDIVLDINLNRALRYYAVGKGRDIQPPLDSRYDKYNNYNERNGGDSITAIENVFGNPKLKQPDRESKPVFTNKNKLFECLCIVALVVLLGLVAWNREYELWFFPETIRTIHKLISAILSLIGLLATTIVLLMMLSKKTRGNRLQIFIILAVILTAILFIQLKLIPCGIGVLITIFICIHKNKQEN